MLATLLLLLAVGCAANKSSSQTGSNQPYWPPGQPPPSGYQPGYPQGPGQTPGVPTAAPQPTAPAIPPAGSLPAVPNDPLNFLDAGYMRQQAQSVLGELVAALPATQRGNVQAIPLSFEGKPGEVNAYAACTASGKALLAVTDSLLEVEAQMARAKATDEVFGTRKLDALLRFIAQNQRPNQALVRPPAAFWDANQDIDGRKVQRQHGIFEEAVAFVLGHELAHHYLQHTGCVGRPDVPVTPQDIGRLLSGAVPVFNQPNEVAADTQGTYNLLTAGSKRGTYRWTENGALLTLTFFDAIRDLSPLESVIFAFELSHPDPTIRIPIVQQAANGWRAGGGAAPSFPFQIPGFTY